MKEWYRGKGGPDQPNISNADMKLLKILFKLNDEGKLLERPLFQEPMLFEECVEDSEQVVLVPTKPEYTFKIAMVATYLDGPPHEKPRQERKDNRIRDVEESNGWVCQRFPYKTMTAAKTKEIIDEIVTVVNKRYLENYQLIFG